MSEINYKSDQNVKQGQLIFSIGGAVVAYSTNATLTITTNVIDTSNKMDGSWQSGVAGKKSWTGSTEALMTEQTGAKSYKDLIASQIAGTPVEVKFGTMKYEENADGSLKNVDVDTTKPFYTGNAIITSNELQSENGALAKSSVQFQGAGPLVTGAITEQ